VTAGGHVLIGDNGSGKTTILRSIALAPLDWPALPWTPRPPAAHR
jgi:ABC-type molybdenum transport system ATPase subunit/photorepair protein PhrA